MKELEKTFYTFDLEYIESKYDLINKRYTKLAPTTIMIINYKKILIENTKENKNEILELVEEINADNNLELLKN